MMICSFDMISFFQSELRGAILSPEIVANRRA
jgi:hypothetical protein